MPIPAMLKDHLRLPVVGAPMFIVSAPELVLAQCKAGIVGSFPALNARPASQLDDWLAQITEELACVSAGESASYGSALCREPNRSCKQRSVGADVRLCVKYRVPIVITSLRPPAEVVSAVHGYGGIVFHDVINLRHAEKAAAQGVDGIIAVCAGAGGHAGVQSPFALVKQIREIYAGYDHFVGRHEHRRRCAGGASTGRGSCVSRHAVHCDGRGQREPGLQADAHRSLRRGHRLHLPVQRRRRQLSARPAS